MPQMPVFVTLALDDTFKSLFSDPTVLSGTLEAPLDNQNAIQVRANKAAETQDWPAGTAAYLEQVDFAEIEAKDPMNAGAKLVFVGQSCPR